MEVKVGWATEYGRDRFDVAVGEEDLARMLAEIGLGAECVPQVATKMVFQLLALEARRFADLETLRFVTDESQRAGIAAKVQKANQQRQELLAQVAAQFGQQPSE